MLGGELEHQPGHPGRLGVGRRFEEVERRKGGDGGEGGEEAKITHYLSFLQDLLFLSK